MAEITTLGFRPGHSLFHRLDARFKLLCLAVIGIAVLQCGIWGLAGLTVPGLAGIFRLGIPLRSMLKELRYLAVLLFLVFAARALSTPGSVLFSAAGISVTREGVAAGVLVCWRLAGVVLAGIIFIAATRPSEIRGAVIRLLAPIPFIPEQQAGTMISLLVRFIPMILNQARETADAQRARCIECRKNPVFRVATLCIALLRRIFEDAERLVVAMEARCYTEDRTGPRFSATSRDWTALIVTAAACAAAAALPF